MRNHIPEAIFSDFPLVYWVRNHDGVILDVSENFERITGVAAAKATGSTIGEIFPGAVARRVDAIHEVMEQRGQAAGMVMWPDGQMWSIRKRRYPGCAVTVVLPWTPDVSAASDLEAERREEPSTLLGQPSESQARAS